MSNNKKNTRILNDIIAIITLSVSVYILLSLFSYNVHDATLFNASHSGSYHNMGGWIGANIADFLLVAFGWSGYLIGLLGVLLFFAIVLREKWEHKWIQISGFLLLIVAISFTISSIVASISISMSGFKHINLLNSSNIRTTGGIVGDYITHELDPYLGKTGSVIAAITLLLVSIILLMKRTITQFFLFFLNLIIKSVRGVAALFKAVATGIIVRKEKKKRIKEKLDIKSKTQDILIHPPTKKEPQSWHETHKRREALQEVLFDNIDSEFKRPSLNLLDDYKTEDIEYNEAELKFNANMLRKKLSDFNVRGEILKVRPGPVITMYEFEPAPGIKVSQIMNLSDDLALAMKVPSVRIQPHIVGISAVGIEVPNAKRKIVYLREVLQSKKFRDSSSVLTLSLGVDTTGDPVVTDLAKMPHLLIGGSTNSGKSVTMNAIIMSFLFKATPDELKLILVDPKMLEFSAYNDIPHLLHEVITDSKEATYVLKWATEEMDKRYSMIHEAGVRNILVYNQMIRAKKLKDPGLVELPKIVIIIDELSDLMFTAPKEVEEYIVRLSQKARAAGIHIIFATQRPSVDVITGTIKSNFSSRIALKVPQKTDSRIILDQSGAEELLGAGDMLFIPPGTSQPMRVHGAYVSDTEVMRITEYLKKSRKPSYEIQLLDDSKQTDSSDGESVDELYDKAIEIIKENGSASISLIQRRLRVGYNRAARMVEQMEKNGVILKSESGNKNIILSK